MRGRDTKQASMLCLISPESVVPSEHPLRAVKRLVEVVLRELSPVFEQMYAKTGRPSLPPERLLKATLLMAFYTVRSERMFCEQLSYNLLFKWFLDMDMHEAAFDPTTFGKNRGRLLQHDVAGHFFRAVVEQARKAGLMSVSPHVAQNRNRRRSAIDGRTTSPDGYAVSVGLRGMIERIFGWMKTTANFRRTRLRGLAKTTLLGTLVGSAYNILRLARLTHVAA